MKICVAGLGLIGGSICMALKRGGLEVDGYNRSSRALDYALERGVINSAVKNFSDYDVVIVALPPRATVDFILGTSFKEGAIVADICGVKGAIERAVYSANLPIRYIGTHPMAGKEVSGIENACADLFDCASMIVTHCDKTDPSAYKTVVRLVKTMGFKYLVECTAELHDRKIAYTSQLAHVVSNCYVNDPEIDGCLGFTGGSFQDMTRIAGVDESVWAELYQENSRNLLEKAKNLQSSLNAFISALESGDKGRIRAVLSVGAEAYRAGKAENFKGEGIEVTALK